MLTFAITANLASTVVTAGVFAWLPWLPNGVLPILNGGRVLWLLSVATK